MARTVQRTKLRAANPHLLDVDRLAASLYEGRGLSNLAEQLARCHGYAGSLAPYCLMSDDVQNFWRGIAKQLIDHARMWNPNEGSCCVLRDEERRRLAFLPRVEP